MKVPLAVIAFGALSGGPALGIPVMMTLELDAIVISNPFTLEDDLLTDTSFSTALPGDAIKVIVEMNTDPGFFHVPDFGTDYSETSVPPYRDPVGSYFVYNSLGMLLGDDLAIYAELEKVGNWLWADTLSGPHVFDLSFSLDTFAWTGFVRVNGQYEWDGEDNYGIMTSAITSGRLYGADSAPVSEGSASVPDSGSSALLFAITFTAMVVGGRRLSLRDNSSRT